MHTLLLGGVLLAYVVIAWQSIQAPLFVLDDGAELAYIRSHPSLAELFQHDCFLFFRPGKNLCFLAFSALLPMGMTACRLLVVLIGVGSALAVLALFRQLLPKSGMALAAIACWLLAPTLVTVTAWLSAVNILLMTGLSAASLLLFLRSRASTGRKSLQQLAGAGFAALLAMFCYEGAVCLPALMVLLEFYLHPARAWSLRSFRAYALFAAALVLYLVLRHLRSVGGQQLLCGNFGAATDLQVALAAPWFFFQHFLIWLWPFGHQAIIGSYFHGQVPTGMLVCAWVGAIVLAAGCLLLRRMPVVALGLAWYLVAFLPMSNLLAFRNGPYGDYYLALASMGLALAFGWTIGTLFECARQGRSLLVVVVVLGGWRLAAAGESLAWSRAWNEPERVLQRTLATFPTAFSAMNEYARLLYQAGDNDGCLAWTDRALALAPHCLSSFELRALVAVRQGKFEQAQVEVDRFLQFGGAGQSWGWYFKGYLLDEQMGDTNGAIRCYQQAVAQRIGWTTDVLDAMNALAFFAVQKGDRRTAIDLWEQVVRADPGRVQVRQNLVRAYAESGDRERAQQQLEIVQKELHGKQR